MAKISKAVREVVVARLLAAWSAKLTSAASDYPSVPSDAIAKLAGIDWTGTARKQFFQGDLDIADIEESTSYVYPVATLTVGNATHDGAEKFVTFSGSATMSLTIWFTWRNGSNIPVFEDVCDLIEDAAVEVFHDRSWLGAIGNGVTYTGELTSSRGAVQVAGDNWRQAVNLSLVFGVDV